MLNRTNLLESFLVDAFAGEVLQLHHHVDGVDGLRHDLAVQATMNLANALRDAAVARAGADALRSIARAYRSFAVDHPGQYASSLLPPSGTEDSLVASHQAILQLFVQVLAAFDISGDDAVHAARTIRSAVHGFVSLEAIDALTLHQPSDESFDHLVEMLVSAVQS